MEAHGITDGLGCASLTIAVTCQDPGPSFTTLPASVAPTITTQPADQQVIIGQTATFTVAAEGTAPLSYQWQKAGTPITGATSASGIITNRRIRIRG